MKPKQVLIVDDDKNILRMLEFGLRKLGPEYNIIIMEDVAEAIQRIEYEYFDLVITDYMMPGMTGIDLLRAVHQISPDSQVILMTAYSTHKLLDTTENLHIDGYLDKPFTMDQLRSVVRHVVSQRANNSRKANDDNDLAQPNLNTMGVSVGLDPIAEEIPGYEDTSVTKQLQQLQVNAGARAVLLIDRKGKSMRVVGGIKYTRLGQISKLVATNHGGSAALSQLLDNKNTFKASFYEGDAYNLYVCDVNSTCLLAVVFDIKLRPGVVWFYAKQTAIALAPLFKE